jgi:hypothetical protein
VATTEYTLGINITRRDTTTRTADRYDKVVTEGSVVTIEIINVTTKHSSAVALTKAATELIATAMAEQ